MKLINTLVSAQQLSIMYCTNTGSSIPKISLWVLSRQRHREYTSSLNICYIITEFYH